MLVPGLLSSQSLSPCAQTGEQSFAFAVFMDNGGA